MQDEKQPTGGGGGTGIPDAMKDEHGMPPPGTVITTGQNLDEGSDLPKDRS